MEQYSSKDKLKKNKAYKFPHTMKNLDDSDQRINSPKKPAQSIQQNSDMHEFKNDDNQSISKVNHKNDSFPRSLHIMDLEDTLNDRRIKEQKLYCGNVQDSVSKKVPAQAENCNEIDANKISIVGMARKQLESERIAKEDKRKNSKTLVIKPAPVQNDSNCSENQPTQQDLLIEKGLDLDIGSLLSVSNTLPKRNTFSIKEHTNKVILNFPEYSLKLDKKSFRENHKNMLTFHETMMTLSCQQKDKIEQIASLKCKHLLDMN